MFNSYQSQLISERVTPNILDISQANIDECFGTYWNNMYQLAYTSKATGGAENNRVLIYDFPTDSYSLDSKTINCMTTLESGDDYGVIYYGNSGADGYVYEEGAVEEGFRLKYKSDLDAGTFDDTGSQGTENNAILDLEWDLTWGADFQTLGYLTMGAMLTSTFAREDTDGSWTSKVYRINADTVDKLYWNEDLNGTGNIEWQMKFGATEAACLSASFGSLYGTPSGSDVSSETANTYMQLRANLSTSDILYTPEVYMSDNYLVKLVYSNEGADYESTVNSQWKSGWIEPKKGYEVTLQWIKVYYQATEGTLNVGFQNMITGAGAIDKSFNIDLAQEPPFKQTNGDWYDGNEGYKIFTYINQEQDIGQHWQFTISDTGVTGWTIDRIEVMAWVNELVQ
jgi:hypothetical protein